MTAMIGDTASISLLTGLPGSGKTLRIIQRIVDLIEQGNIVYTCNITGISVPGIIPFEDPRKWPDLPPGAILFVDEAQAFFPARRAGDPPPHIRAMSTIRHGGVRLVLVTQQPDYLDTYVRGLVGFHEHLYRTSGGNETFIFRNNQVMDQIRLPFKRIKSLYDYEKWALPNAYFKFYKSAEIHTVKYRMPAILKKALVIGPLSLLGIVVAFYGVYHFATPDIPIAADDASTTTSATGASVSLDVKTPEQYVQQFVPRVSSQPWSAPAYDELARPENVPRVFCMIGGDQYTGTCTCLTEQGTRYNLGLTECRIVVKQGQYEPFLRPRQSDSDRTNSEPSAAQPSSPVASTAVGVGVTGWQGQQTRYGQFRNDPVGGDPSISH